MQKTTTVPFDSLHLKTRINAAGGPELTPQQASVLLKTFLILLAGLLLSTQLRAQIVLLQDHQNYVSAPIGTYQGIAFREAGLSGLYAIPNTNGKEFWTLSDRGVNIDAANANLEGCRPTYDKIYAFPDYAPKIHRIRISGDSVQILKSITIKRPNGTPASGIINPTGFGSTATEIASTDTVLNCNNFSLKTTPKDIWGIDSEGIAVDREGNFWVCEEGGPTIWKINPNGVVLKRFTPYANLLGSQPEDVAIDSVFKYRKNNRGFEGITITPNGKVYAVIQSPILYPTKSVGEGTRIHRILEIDPITNTTRMFAYLNDGIIGASGSNQIRLRDWKIGDMVAINDHSFLVLEAALRGTTDIKKMYKIDIQDATPVTSGLYNGKTLEAWVDAAGLNANGITPVTKTLFMDLLSNGWPAALDKAEGLTIINDSTIAISNDNDYGQYSPLENGVASPTSNTSHVFVFGLKGNSKLVDFMPANLDYNQGITGISTSQTPYIVSAISGANVTSILTAKDVINGYKMAGIPDGMGAYDNGDSTFTLLVNHEIPATSGVIRAHGATGAFVSAWTINKNNLSVMNGQDLIQKSFAWDATTNSFVQTPVAFSRFCSGDLPAISAFYNTLTGLGTQERIFMNGEESGPEGRAFGHILTGADAGTTYQLPYLGRFSWENSIACPFPNNKTIVAGTDDATPGQVYIYIGNKTNTGTAIDKAGLNNGKLFGVSVQGLTYETSASFPTAGTTFSLVDLGFVQNTTGADLNLASNNAGVTNFLRPEDGQWDPANPNDFYFVTTNSFTSPSRLWRLRFIDITHPEIGGFVEVLLDGSEGPKMMDNMTIDQHGRVLLQEDVGNQTHLGKIWQYSIGTDSLTLIAQHDPYRFIAGAPGFLTQDEESSGIIDAEEILGEGKFLLNVQAHYPIAGEVYEGGQLLMLENTNQACLLTAGEIIGNTNACDFVLPAGKTAVYTITAANASGYRWTIPSKAIIVSGQGTNTIQVKYLPGFIEGSVNVRIQNACGGEYLVKRLKINKSKPETPAQITGPANVCEYIESQTTVTYTIPAVEGALSYVWFVPQQGIVVSGQGTTSITILFKRKFNVAAISVKAIAACGASQLQSLILEGNCKTTGETNYQIYPVPTAGPITIAITSPSKTNYKLTITEIISGRTAVQTSGELNEGDNTLTPDLSLLRNGFYILTIRTAQFTITERIEIRH